MALDPANFISELSPSDPPGSDPASQADDHIRATKKSTVQTFPGSFDGPLEATPTEIEAYEGRIAALEGQPVETKAAPVSGIVVATADVNAIVVTGVGFQPAAIMVMTSRPAVGSNQAVSIGMGSDTFQACVRTGASGSNNHNEGASYFEGRMYSLERYDIATTTIAQGQLLSLDADGFTIGKNVSAEAVTLLWQAFE